MGWQLAACDRRRRAGAQAPAPLVAITTQRVTPVRFDPADVVTIGRGMPELPPRDVEWAVA